MRLLVTGGAGFIGSNFIRFWLANHPADSVVNIDKLTYAGNPQNVEGLERSTRYRFVLGDICDCMAVDDAMNGCDAVVHFAAESHVDNSIKEPHVFLMTNVIGTQVLLDAAKRHGVRRFHHISTDEVFGSLPLDGEGMFDETTPYDPRSPYSASKAASDHLVKAYFHTFGLPVTISNCSNNYGPYQHPEKLIPLAITNLLEGKSIPVYGEGKNIRDWLHVDDHCRAIERILEDGTVGETYCVGGPDKHVTNNDVAHAICAAFGLSSDRVAYVRDRPGHDLRYSVDFSKLKQELGWTPSIDFTTGLASTIEWYAKNRPWWERLKS